MRIKIIVGSLSMEAEMFDTSTANKIINVLPIETQFNTWGEEIYFEIPVDESLDSTATEVVEVGDLGYWPRGKALCIFFGETPISEPGKIKPASAVNIVGRIRGDATKFKDVMNEETIRLEAISED